MGRGNGKLIPFLNNGLQYNLYLNLKYESSNIINVELPRYEKKKIAPYEKILMGWYTITGNANYPGYSTAKAVFQAALKKSIFLIPLDSIGGKLRFRFATKEEIDEKRKALKLKKVKKEAWNENSMDVSSPQNPPSVASSGYVSGGEECTEMFSDLKPCMLEHNLGSNEDLKNKIIITSVNLLQNQMSYNKHVSDCLLQDQMTYDEHVPDCLLQDQMTYDEHLPDTLFEDEKKFNNVSSDEFPLDLDAFQLWDGDGDYTNYLESLLNKATSDNSSQETVQNVPLNEATSVSSCDGGFQNISLNEATVSSSSDEAAQDGVVQQSAKSDDNLNNVVEVKFPLVTESQVPKKKYWLATQKQKIGDILMLVHEKKEIEAGNQQILEGSACVPEDVWEPGFSYYLKKDFELNGRYFRFFICEKV